MTLARILCVIVLLLEARGLSLSVSDRKWRILIFYTQLSNLVTTVSALLASLLHAQYFDRTTIICELFSCRESVII